MLTLPNAIGPVLHPFATLFRNPTWLLEAQIILVGTILAPGQRTVPAALRVVGRTEHRNYARYHEVLNRAVWSPRHAARILMLLLLQHLDQGAGPLVFGIDEILVLQRRFMEGGRRCYGRGQCGVSRERIGPVRCAVGHLSAIAAVPPGRTALGAKAHAPLGAPGRA